ncbi:amino acid adenylation domain-containing protein [Chromobacterium sp. CV08]|uniref:amino acid adenylation domain-containing protein n=1 Tax=Chromobacterium sp. CV08 TaxID=3133274 RepID=UPI003DA9CDFD
MQTNRLITDYFADTARDNPDPAIRWGKGMTLSWLELYARARRLARHLAVERGLRRGDCVAIGLERSPDFLVAAYAVLLAGGVYFPLDAKTPAARMAAMLETAQCRLAFCAEAQAGRFAEAAAGLALIPREQLDTICRAGGDAGYDAPRLRADDPAYLIFTSGSTGAPKGVLVNHGALINRLQWHQLHSRMTAADIILQRTALTFDVSLWELFLPALNGASHYLLQPGLESFARGVTAALDAEGVTVVHFVPSLLKPVLQELQDSGLSLPALRQVYVSGEPLPASLVDRFRRQFGSRCLLTNLYGPTEAAIDVSFYDCDEAAPAAVPIGRALSGCRLHIVDPDTLALKADSEVGEIAISGICLADGYYNRRDLTDKAFVFHPDLGERVYLSGDLGWREDGELFFCQGRKDTQVKLRGLRIELGEIEHHLLNHEAVIEAAACVVTDGNGEQWLVAAVVAGADEIDPQALRRFLAEQVPAYMLPARYWQTGTLPRTGSGKLDRAAIAGAVRERFFADTVA